MLVEPMSEIAWRTHGSGPPLLLLNGYAATGDDWDPTLIEGLAAAHTVVCPDNRGTGDSALGSEELTVAAMAEDAAGVLDELGVARAAVAGWSMGGFIAQQLAASHPERVGALVLMATDPGGPGAALAAPREAALLVDRGGSPREQATRLIGLLFPEPFAAAVDAEFGALVAAARAALDPATLDAQEAAMAHWHASPAEERLAAIAAPTLVLAGAEDVVIPAANAPLLAAAIAGARLVEPFADCGHGFLAQRPAEVAETIGGFLREAD